MNKNWLYSAIINASDFIPGDLERALNTFTAPGQKTPYEYFLTNIASDLHPKHIVDLAAGSGPVAKAIIRSAIPYEQLTLIDINQNELDLASKAFQDDKRVNIVCEDFYNNNLAPSSVDLLTCHLGFPIFPDAQRLVEEILRILRPGGECIFNILRSSPDNLDGQYYSICQQYEQYVDGFEGWGDVRTTSPDNMENFLRTNTALTQIHFHPYSITIQKTPSELFQYLKTFYQIPYLLPKDKENGLQKDLSQLLANHTDQAGLVSYELPLLLGSFRKRQS